MTQNEVDIIKNSVIDATEAYVEARLECLNFVKTQIGIVIDSYKDTNSQHSTYKKYIHTVRCNATRQNPNGITYNNVLSVGNTQFPNNSVVFLVAPNAQFSNQFILGKLDDTPCNIVGGSIRLGGNDENDAPIYLTSTPLSSGEYAGSYGHIGGFYIFDKSLKVDDAILNSDRIGCGSAGDGIINLVGNNNQPYLAMTDSGSWNTFTDGIVITGIEPHGSTVYRGVVRAYNDSGQQIYEKFFSNIPDADFGTMLHQYIEEDSGTGYLEWK